MKVKTWLKYEIGYVPPRCHKTRYKEVEEFFDSTIKEVGSSDVQLAFEDNAYDGKGRIFFRNGKLWSKRKITETDMKYTGADNAIDVLKYVRLHCSNFFFPRWGSSEHPDRKEAIAAVRKANSKLLIIDGELYEQTEEPMYCIYTFGLGHNHGGSHLAVSYHYNPNIASSAYFNANQGEEAVAEAKATALARGDTESVDRMKANIVVHLPELVKRKPNAQHKRGGNKLLQEYEEIVKASPDALSAGLLILGAAGKEQK